MVFCADGVKAGGGYSGGDLVVCDAKDGAVNVVYTQPSSLPQTKSIKKPRSKSNFMKNPLTSLFALHKNHPTPTFKPPVSPPHHNTNFSSIPYKKPAKDPSIPNHPTNRPWSEMYVPSEFQEFTLKKNFCHVGGVMGSFGYVNGGGEVGSNDVDRKALKTKSFDNLSRKLNVVETGKREEEYFENVVVSNQHDDKKQTQNSLQQPTKQQDNIKQKTTNKQQSNEQQHGNMQQQHSNNEEVLRYMKEQQRLQQERLKLFSLHLHNKNDDDDDDGGGGGRGNDRYNYNDVRRNSDKVHGGYKGDGEYYNDDADGDDDHDGGGYGESSLNPIFTNRPTRWTNHQEYMQTHASKPPLTQQLLHLHNNLIVDEGGDFKLIEANVEESRRDDKKNLQQYRLSSRKLQLFKKHQQQKMLLNKLHQQELLQQQRHLIMFAQQTPTKQRQQKSTQQIQHKHQHQTSSQHPFHLQHHFLQHQTSPHHQHPHLFHHQPHNTDLSNIITNIILDDSDDVITSPPNHLR